MIALIQSISAVIVFGVFVIGSLQQSDYVPIHPVVTDRPDRERIELSYTNVTEHFLCLDGGSWPTPGGKLHFAGDDVALVVSGRKFPIEDFNTGYCLGPDCTLRVAPKAKIFGFLLYEDFHLPAPLRYEAKRLEYSVTAWQCDVVPDWRPNLKPN